MLLRDLVRLSNASHHDIEGVIIASVVPNVMYSLTNACIKYFHVHPVIVGPGVKTGVKVGAENPKEAGSDLIVNAAAVKELYGVPNDEVWNYLGEHPVFPTRDYKNKIKDVLKRDFDMKASRSSMSFSDRSY